VAVAWLKPPIRPRRSSTAPPRKAMSSGAGPSSRGLAGALHAGHQPMNTASVRLIALNGPG